MLLDRIATPGLAQVAYLVADEGAGVVAVIDPRRDVDAYLGWAVARELRIGAILETHIHADFVSGSWELAAATGAPIYVSTLGGQAFPHESLGDGDEVAVGELKLRAFWTPGHTPEHLAYLLFTPGRDVPLAMFSGDALFVGEVGQPEVLGAEEARSLTEQLYQTVVDRLRPLRDALMVYPGHTAGSSCGRNIGDAPYTNMRRERLFNDAFQVQSKEAFDGMVLGNMPAPPTYFPILKKVNAEGPRLLGELPAGEPLGADEVAARGAAGALIIDTRSPAAFGAGHVPGAVFAGLGASFTTWLGWLAPYDRDLILVLDEDTRYEVARTELRRIGLDRIAGYLAGGMAAWRGDGREVATLPQISAEDLAAQRAGGDGDLVVLDVRSDAEWASGHIPGARHRFGGEIVQGAAPPVEDGARVAVICGGGYRSSVVASLLQGRGYRNLVNVEGGMSAWQGAGLPTTKD